MGGHWEPMDASQSLRDSTWQQLAAMVLNHLKPTSDGVNVRGTWGFCKLENHAAKKTHTNKQWVSMGK